MARPRNTIRIVRRYGIVQQHGHQTPVRIILHTTEGDTASGAFATFQNSPQGLGAQYIIDADGTIYQTMPDNQIAYGTGGNNNGSINIEIVAHASFSAAQWAQRAAQIQSVENLMGYLAGRYNIPLRLTPKNPHLHGVTTHAMNSALYPSSLGHTDPGRFFPLRSVVSAAAKQAGQIPTYGGYKPGDAPAAPTPPAYEPPIPATGPQPPTTYTPNIMETSTTGINPADVEVNASIANIPQPPGPPLAGAPLEGDFADVGQLQPYGAAFDTAQTWRAIIGQGDVSADTLRLAQMAQYGA